MNKTGATVDSTHKSARENNGRVKKDIRPLNWGSVFKRREKEIFLDR